MGLLRFDLNAVIAMMGEGPPSKPQKLQDSYWLTWCALIKEHYGEKQEGALFLLGAGPDEFESWRIGYAARQNRKRIPA